MVGLQAVGSERLVLIAPGMVGTPESPGVLREAGRVTRRLEETGSVFRLGRSRGLFAFDALGLDPSRYGMPEGPLWVAGLGADPPDRSVEFCLSLGSISEAGRLVAVTGRPRLDGLESAIGRLATRSLKPVVGPADQHGLVWERGSLDLGLKPWHDASGHFYRDVWPEGDGESALRRLIQDSVELLGGLDANRQRIDEGLPPLNVLWPWAAGIRRDVPNLALRRGEPAKVETDDLATVGLARLVRYRFGPPPVRDRQEPGTRIIDLPSFASDDPERTAEEWAQIEKSLLEPVLSRPGSALLVACPGADGGLAVWTPGDGRWPFDERTLTEEQAPSQSLWSLVDDFLAPQT